MPDKTALYPFRRIPLLTIDITKDVPNAPIFKHKMAFDEFVNKRHYDLAPEFGVGFRFQTRNGTILSHVHLKSMIRDIEVIRNNYSYYDLHLEHNVTKEPWSDMILHHFWVIFTQRPNSLAYKQGTSLAKGSTNVP